MCVERWADVIGNAAHMFMCVCTMQIHCCNVFMRRHDGSEHMDGSAGGFGCVTAYECSEFVYWYAFAYAHACMYIPFVFIYVRIFMRRALRMAGRAATIVNGLNVCKYNFDWWHRIVRCIESNFSSASHIGGAAANQFDCLDLQFRQLYVCDFHKSISLLQTPWKRYCTIIFGYCYKPYYHAALINSHTYFRLPMELNWCHF